MDLAAARAALRAARRVAVLTGAGVSAESGIPTFRDAQTGHWARFRPEDLASPDAYARDPDTVWAWYAGRYADVTRARPNAAHTALAALQARVGEGFTLVTQNVDGLHARAGSVGVVELHGNLTTARCETCGYVQALPDPDAFTPPPACARCGHRMRPNVVWFGELLPEAALDAAARAFESAEVALVIGTSSVVQPAASLALLTAEAGGTIIEINPERTPLSAWAALTLHERAGEGLQQLLHA
jgi:NAD-dependent deacetylase